MYSIAVGHQDQGHMLVPIMLMCINKHGKLSENGSIQSLDHPIRLRVQWCCPGLPDSQECTYFSEHNALETSVLITRNLQ